MGTIFDPEELHEIVRRAVGQPIEQTIGQIVADLAERHPGHVVEQPEWVFNNAGGAMGSMMVLHASLTEYVIIFGSAIGTEGASGRFWADDWFFVLEGEHWSYAEGDLHKTITRPGEVARLGRRQAQGYRLLEGSWALEYARGAIPLMLPFGLADTFTSTLDFVALARTMKIYAGAVTRSTATQIAGTRLERFVPARLRREPGGAPRMTPRGRPDGSNGHGRAQWAGRSGL